MTADRMLSAEIPVSDLNKAARFYAEVFGWQMKRDDAGPNPVVNFTAAMSNASGHLYPGKPANNGDGPTVHLVLPDKLEDGISRCQKAGGTVISPVIDIPPGRFAYALDPDGNSIGLFEPKAA